MRAWSLAAFRLTLSICLFFSAGAALAAEWLPLLPDAAGTAVEIRLESATHEATTAIVEVPGLRAAIRDSADGGFSVLSFDGGDLSGDLGRPELPVLRRLIEVPPGAEVRVRLDVLGAHEVRSLAGWGLPGRIWPVQPPRVKLESAGPAPAFAFDRDRYATERLLPRGPGPGGRPRAHPRPRAGARRDPAAGLQPGAGPALPVDPRPAGGRGARRRPLRESDAPTPAPAAR